MGCFSSKNSFDKIYYSEEFHKWNAQFSALQLTKSEVKRMYKVFRKVDFDGGGTISIAELLSHIDLERTRFSERIFSIFDEDGSGEIDFREFVLSLWNYCTLTKVTLDMFAFDIYDRDSSGELSSKEVAGMLKEIYGNEVKTNFHAKNIANELQEMEVAGKVLDVDQFRDFVKTHHALLFPAFQMQMYLQKYVLGRRFWEQNAERRIRVSRGLYVPIAKFLEMNIDKRLLENTMSSSKNGGPTQKLDARAEMIMKQTGTSAKRKKAKLGIEGDETGSSHAANVMLARMSAKDLANFGGGASASNENDVTTQSLTELYNKSGKATSGKSSRSIRSGKGGGLDLTAPPEAMATSGKYGTFAGGAGGSSRRHSVAGAGHAVAFASSKKSAKSGKDSPAPILYAGNEGAGGGAGSSKKHASSSSRRDSAPVVALTMAAVSAKTEVSPIEAWESLPDVGIGGTGAGAGGVGGGVGGAVGISRSEKSNVSKSGKFRAAASSASFARGSAKIAPAPSGGGIGLGKIKEADTGGLIDLEDAVMEPSTSSRKVARGSGNAGRRRSVI